MSGFKAVVFDFGNVLCRLNRPAANTALAAHSPLSPDEVGRRIWGGDIEREVETGRYDSHEHFKRIKERIEGEASWGYETFAEEYMKALEPFPEGEEALASVRARGLRTFVLSNTSFLHSRFIFQRELLASVPELHALSYKVGRMKPDPGIWLWLLDRASLEARDCLYVDDVGAYCEAAASLGFATLRFEIDSQDLARELGSVLY
jgi:HAD superfamily hydrolase (TIGR01509 family)